MGADRSTQSGASLGWTSRASPISHHGQMLPCCGPGGGLSVSSDVTQRAEGLSIESAALAGSKGSSASEATRERRASNSPGPALTTSNVTPGVSAVSCAGSRPPVQQVGAPTLNRGVSNGAVLPTVAATSRPVGGSAKVYPSWQRPQFATTTAPSQAQVTDPASPKVGSPVLRSYRVLALAGVQASPQQIATGRERRAATGALSPVVWPGVSGDLAKTPSPRRSSSPTGPITHGLQSRFSPVHVLSGSMLSGSPSTVTRTGSP